MLRKTALLTSVSILIFTTSPVAAEQMSMEQIQAQLQQLAAQVQKLSEVVEKQNQVIKTQEAALEAQKQVSAQAIASIQPVAGAMTGDVKISMKPSPKIESLDGNYSFQPFGRVHLDTTHFDDDAVDHPSNGNFRRARLGFKGQLGEDFKYKSEMDFAEESVNFKEVSLSYTGLDSFDIKVGHHKPSFGLEQNTSSNYLMFMERAAPTNAFTRDEEIGLNIMGGGNDWTLAAGIFNQDARPTSGDPDEDITFDVRGSVNLLGGTDNVLHIGAGYSHRRPDGSINFDAAPAGEGSDIIDTGSIDSVENVDLYGAELAAVARSLSFQGEYFRADVSRDNGNRDADFDGYYAQAGWLLTGEERPYKKGNFKRIVPDTPFSLKNEGWGAWELLARYESVDLNDASAGITGGELDNFTLGLNWHLTKHVRLMANVTDINTERGAIDDDPTLYNFRAQWDF